MKLSILNNTVIRTNENGTATLCGAYFAVFIALGLTTGSLGPTIPALAARTNVSIATISYLFTARSFGYVIGSSRLGHLFDRYTGNPVLAGTLMVVIATLVVIPLTTSWWILITVMFLLGNAEATLDVGVNSLLAWLQRNRLGPALNALHSFFGIGALAAPMLVGVLVSFGRSPVDVYYVLAFVVLPLPLLLTRWPSPAKPTTENRNHEVKDTHIVVLIAIFFFFYSGAEVGFGGWVFTYATQLGLASESTAAYLTSGFFAALTVGRFLGVPLAKHLRSTTILIADLFGSMVSVGCLALAHQSLSLTVVGTVGLGLSIASIFPTTLSLAAETMGLTGKVTGKFIVGASLGFMTLPLIVGQLFALFGPQAMLAVVFGCLVSASASLLLIVLDLQRRILAQIENVS